MPKPTVPKVITCVAYGCEIWNGPLPADDDIRALMHAHALVHYNRPITIANLFGEDTGSSEE
ncbi:hypothetical protein [Nocardia sp. CC227C]|uniref:hypothetical protein n=1 Tax=Nocardia sp. CC227C TaxID=3044562 RepID=UPI00278BDB70|nr:hypothetical protein [Nocardia sp. CC227C]